LQSARDQVESIIVEKSAIEQQSATGSGGKNKAGDEQHTKGRRGNNRDKSWDENEQQNQGSENDSRFLTVVCAGGDLRYREDRLRKQSNDKKFHGSQKSHAPAEARSFEQKSSAYDKWQVQKESQQIDLEDKA